MERSPEGKNSLGSDTEKEGNVFRVWDTVILTSFAPMSEKVLIEMQSR